MWNQYGYKPQPTVAQRRAKAAKKLGELRKKGADVSPVVVTGTALTKTWWGKAWNENLALYAEFESRLSRGRSYVRSGAVLDLRIDRGRIQALVQGSRAAPYKVEVGIDPLPPDVWSRLVESCAGRIDSLQELLEGRFPKELGERFTTPGRGLFPKPSEIHMDCTCPDWATMCKHVVASLLGVGARLDHAPELFFTLRGVKVDELVSAAAVSTASGMLKQAGNVTSRVLRGSNADVSALFGVDLDEEDAGGGTGAAGPAAGPAAAAAVTVAVASPGPKKRGRPKKAVAVAVAVAVASPGPKKRGRLKKAVAMGAVDVVR